MRKSIEFHTTHKLTVIHWQDNLELAQRTMKSIPSRHLPVIDDAGAIVGMLSDRDLKRASKPYQDLLESEYIFESQFEAGARVKDYMSWPVETVDEKQSIADAARIMIDKKISSLIVTRESMAVGVVTTEDLLSTLVEESEKLSTVLVDGLTSVFYRSPIGTIAQSLSNAGL
jgi:CBS domain-containing membrane protein